MDRAKVTTELTAIFRDVFDDDALAIDRDTTAAKVKGWDSTKMIELIMAAESHFGVQFTTFETDDLGCVGDFIDLIAAKAE